MNLFTLFRDVNTKEQAVEYLQAKNVLHRRRVCRNGHDMSLRFVASDLWICCQKSCRHQVGLRVGTWFQDCHILLEHLVWFIYAWCRQYTSVKFCYNELLMSCPASSAWRHNLREVCAKSLLLNPQVIGGEGLTVEMHQSCFGRKSWKTALAQQWVFGGVCRETSECFLFAVAEPTAETLLEAVSASVRPGSTIVSNLFKSYGGSELLPEHYTLLSMNQSQCIFVNPSTGNEEGAIFAKRPKRKYRPDTVHRGQDSHLCEFLWRKRHENVNLVEQIYKDIARVYPLQDVVQ